MAESFGLVGVAWAQAMALAKLVEKAGRLADQWLEETAPNDRNRTDWLTEHHGKQWDDLVDGKPKSFCHHGVDVIDGQQVRAVIDAAMEASDGE